MKFSDYVRNINELLENNPRIADYDVVSSKDDEGNGFSLVHFAPSIGEFDGDDYTDIESEDFGGDDNAVCIN